FQNNGDSTYKLTGDLTMHGISKQVSMDVEYTGAVENPMTNKMTVGFQLTGVLKRSDFGIGTNFPPPMISDEVRIKADGEFVK
ncbi:MAG: YceI family protein, partial [Moraxellaceae bacterium]